MSVTISEGDALTPANLNAWVKSSVEAFNVKSPTYGAVGDGSTDDTAAIQAAIAAAYTSVGWTGSESGAIVFLPAGDYQVSDDIDIPNGVTLLGAGQWNTRINWASASDATDAVITSNLTGAYHPSKLVVSSKLVDIRINANGVASKAIHIRGWQEGCHMRGVTASSATSVCFDFDAVDDAADGFGVIQNAIFEDLRAIPLSGTIGFKLRDVRRCDFRRLTVDMVEEDPTSSVAVGLQLIEDCYLNTFNVCNFEDCTLAIEVNTSPATGFNDCDNNNFLSISIGSSSATPGQTTVGTLTNQRIAVLLRSGCKYYNFFQLRMRYAYDYLLYDETKDQAIPGDSNIGGDVTARGFVLSAGDTTWLSEDLQQFDGAAISSWTANANAADSDQTALDVSATNNAQIDTSNTSVSIHGLSGGVRGQRVWITKSALANTLTVVNNSGSGEEKILTPDGVDVVMKENGYGAVLATYNGSTWRVANYKPRGANGTTTLVNGTTSIAVTHGLGTTPDLQDISVTPVEAWGSATQFWITSPTSTTFTINVDVDPGQDVDFVWTASIQ